MTDHAKPLAPIEALLTTWESEGLHDSEEVIELRAALAEARQAVDALVSERDGWRRQLQELQSESRILPCDAGCFDAPEEDCSRHGREPSDLWRIIDEIRTERDAAREALARVEALQVHWETALGLNSCPSCGHIPEMDCDHGEGYHHALSDIRAALAQPATDEEAGSALPLHRTEAGWPRCSTCDGGGCPDCTDPA